MRERNEGYHIFGEGLCRDDGCPLHDACLECPEKRCVDEDRRLSHREWLWLRHMATLLRIDDRDKKHPALYQRALNRLRDYAICKSKNERRQQRLRRLPDPTGIC